MNVSTTVTVDLTSDPTASLTGPPTEVLLLTYPGNEQPQALAPDLHESTVVQPLMTAFAAVQHHWASIVAAQTRGRVVVLAPAVAALGHPEKPLDAAVVGGLISFVRSLAIELQRYGATAHILFFDDTPNDPAVQVMIATLIDDTSYTVTGQEIYLANDTSLGKLRP